MKSLVVFLFLVAIGCTQPVSDEIKAAIRAIHEECKEESGLEKEDIMKVFDEDGEEEKVKQHVYCFHQKMGIIDDEGKIDRSILTEKLTNFLEDEARAQEIVAKCADEAEEQDSPLEVAFVLGRCIYREKIAE